MEALDSQEVVEALDSQEDECGGRWSNGFLMIFVLGRLTMAGVGSGCGEWEDHWRCQEK